MLRTNSSFFSGASRPVLEIKPTSSFVVFHGTPSESQPADITGTVVLHNPEAMSVKGVRITLTGTRKVSWNTTTTVTPQPIVHKQIFLRETKNFVPPEWGKGKSHKINAGEHTWEFKFTLPSSAEESVEGLGMNYIVYDLHASVDRGYMSKALTAHSHIRVIRTIGQDAAALMPREQINEDIWANKLAYKLTVPQKDFIVGTSISVDFVLVPLKEGIKITTIKMELVESRHLFCDYAGRRIGHHAEVVVASMEGTLPPDSKCLVPADTTDIDHIFDEAHRFTWKLNLPRTLKTCRQSVDTEHIRLSHKLRLYVNLLNPQGHTSQLLVKNSVRLFISPNLPPNEDQSVVVDDDVINSQAVRDVMTLNAPPEYGLHNLDRLYNDIDPSGFMTPGGVLSLANSGTTTPLYAHSRTGSAEDLTSLDAALNQQGGASAAALHHRLQNLSINNNGQNARSSRYAPNRHQSSGGSSPYVEYHPLFDPNVNLGVGYVPPALDYDMDALTRTPSYNTAVRTPARPDLERGLPSYENATSRPPSPGDGSPHRRGIRDSLELAHRPLDEETVRNTVLNSRRGSPRRGTGEGRASSEDGRLPPLPTTVHPPLPPSAHPPLPLPPAFRAIVGPRSRSHSRSPSLPAPTSHPTSHPKPVSQHQHHHGHHLHGLHGLLHHHHGHLNGGASTTSPQPTSPQPTSPQRPHSSSDASAKPVDAFRAEDAGVGVGAIVRDVVHNPFRRVLRNVE